MSRKEMLQLNGSNENSSNNTTTAPMLQLAKKLQSIFSPSESLNQTPKQGFQPQSTSILKIFNSAKLKTLIKN